MVTKLMAVVTLILVIVTVGCSFVGEVFDGGGKGQMVFGLMTLVSFVLLFSSILK